MAGWPAGRSRVAAGSSPAHAAFITSSFTLTNCGQLDEFHNGLIFLP
jgi:hypothetical protein